MEYLQTVSQSGVEKKNNKKVKEGEVFPLL